MTCQNFAFFEFSKMQGLHQKKKFGALKIDPKGLINVKKKVIATIAIIVQYFLFGAPSSLQKKIWGPEISNPPGSICLPLKAPPSEKASAALA